MLRLVMLAALVLLCEARPVVAQTPGGTGGAAVCVYRDRTYSEGAAICPQTRLMLLCSFESQRMVWKTVADPALSDRCVAPALSAHRAPSRRSVRAVRVARTPSPAVADGAAKCFTFNNKRYCE
jgi:Protein of unknown function (DUF1496)